MLSPYIRDDADTRLKELELECYGPHPHRETALIFLGMLALSWLLLWSLTLWV